MELNQFVVNVKDQFDDPVEPFNADTKFKEQDEWSSLTSLSIIAMIDDEYGIVVKADDLKSVATVGELFELVKAKSNN